MEQATDGGLLLAREQYSQRLGWLPRTNRFR
jgi:hypothetical protein